jgi:hypothetical protein
MAVVVGLVIGVVLVIVIFGNSPGPNIRASVLSVKVLSGSEIRVFMRYKNDGKSAASLSCQIHTNVYNQFGDQVNLEDNSTGTNGNVGAGNVQIIYQDIGVNSGDAPYITVHDVSLTDCS